MTQDFVPVPEKDLERERLEATIPHTVAVLKIIAEHDHKWGTLNEPKEIFDSNIACAQKIVDYAFEHNLRLYDFDIFLNGFLQKSKEIVERVNMHMNQRIDNIQEATLGKRVDLLTLKEIDDILTPWLEKKGSEKAKAEEVPVSPDEVIETLSEGTVEPTA